MKPKNAGWHYQRAYILAKRSHLAVRERIGERAYQRCHDRGLSNYIARMMKELEAE
jgi:hypothetical protein